MLTELLADGGLTALGFALGRLPSRRRGPKPVNPVCGCTHHHSFHDLKTGQCHSLMDGQATEFSRYRYRNPVAWKQVPCTCRQYSGPVPVDAGYFAPELIQGE